MRSFIILLFAIISSVSFFGCKDNSPVTPVDSSNISLVSVYSTNASTNGVFVLPINARNYALIADGTNGMQIIDVTLVNQPDSLSSYNTDGSANDVTAATINGDLYAFISDYSNGLNIVDISIPSNPQLVGIINAGLGLVNTTFVDANNQLAYVSTSAGNFQIYDISTLPNEPTLLSGTFTGSTNVNGLYASGNYLYLACGDIGLKIMDISNPSSPQSVSLFNTTGFANDVIVNTTYAYVADSFNGMLILDVSNPAAPVLKSKFTGTGQILGIYANNNNVFCADNTYGIENVNVSNPNSPSKAGYIQTNSSANNIFYFGGYIFLAAAEGGLGIYQPANASDLR
jgi:hypothetical protein